MKLQSYCPSLDCEVAADVLGRYSLADFLKAHGLDVAGLRVGISRGYASREGGRQGCLSDKLLIRHFRREGERAIARMAATQPAAYCKILTLLVPREHKVQHSNPIKDLTDEQLETMIEHIKAPLEAHARGPVKEATALAVLEASEMQVEPAYDRR
jgi:hypothetical protein